MWDFLLPLSFLSLVLAVVIRQSLVCIWRSIDDPFGRPCKNLDRITHPEYATLKATHPYAVFVQLDVVIRDVDVTTTVSTLLRGPEENGDEQHLAYYKLEGVVFFLRVKETVESVVQPWEDKGYIPVAGSLSRSYV